MNAISRPPAPIQHDPSNERAPPDEDEPITFRDPIDVMPTTSFSSSNVHSALYDFGEAELMIRYLREGPDAIYRYEGVPPSTWDGLFNAQSKGSYINANIAFSYPYQKVGRDDFPNRGHGLTKDLARRFVTAP